MNIESNRLKTLYTAVQELPFRLHTLKLHQVIVADLVGGKNPEMIETSLGYTEYLLDGSHRLQRIELCTGAGS